MDKKLLKNLGIKFRYNKLSELEKNQLADFMNLNLFYIKNPSSWDIMESILQKIYWKIADENIENLPDNWIDEFKNC